jgi:hypothetical protein
MFVLEEMLGDDVQKTLYFFGSLIAVLAWACVSYVLCADMKANPALLRSCHRIDYVDRKAQPVAYWGGLCLRLLLIVVTGYFVAMLMAKAPQVLAR